MDLFFLAVALVMLGPGQELGRSLDRLPNRLQAYTLNITGSLVGILLFSLCSQWELSPIWWFVPVVAGLTYFLVVGTTAQSTPSRWRILPWAAPALGCVLALASWTSGASHTWSRYYRIDYSPSDRLINVNLIGHQTMVSRADDHSPSFAYALPYLLRRDSGGAAFNDVLIVGAGSGNDVSRALAWGAHHVDAVEIDPAILRIGVQEHPDRPYQDPRVSVHVGDGRNYLRNATASYDLIVFALVDSLVLHSGYSNIRLESFMFTREAFADARAHLKPTGMLVVYNYFRQGWIVDRLSHGLEEAFAAPPLVLTLPFRAQVDPDADEGFTMLLAGDVQRLQDRFAARPAYWLAANEAPSPTTPNGFDVQASANPTGWIRFGPAQLLPAGDLRDATDDWPFLYLRSPMIPALSLRGMAIMGGLGGLLLLFLLRSTGQPGARLAFDGRMFFLGAGFMLVETTAVVHMALLFGSTWAVNTLVFAGVLVTILAANLLVAWARATRVWPHYVGLGLALSALASIPLDTLLGLGSFWQVLLSGVLCFTPFLFAGMIFAICFSRSIQPDRDFGVNVAGALAGGLAENSSMLLGFQHLTIVIALFYALSAVLGRRPAAIPQ